MWSSSFLLAGSKGGGEGRVTGPMLSYRVKGGGGDEEESGRPRRTEHVKKRVGDDGFDFASETGDKRQRVAAAAAAIENIIFTTDDSNPEEVGVMGEMDNKNVVGTVYMTPTNFLALAAPLNAYTPETRANLDSLEAGLRSGYAMAPCRLWVKQSRTAGTFDVILHEGRHRMLAVSNLLGSDRLVPVQIATLSDDDTLADVNIIRREHDPTFARRFKDVATMPSPPLSAVYFRIMVSSDRHQPRRL
jgi:hypothetical protein